MSSKPSKKRERGANYTIFEKEILANLIKQYKHIVDDKGTGAKIIKEKKEAWNAITMKYNSKCTTGARGIEQLKALYDNMKQKARKTGGEINKTECILEKTQLQDQVDPLLNPFDSAAVYFKHEVNINQKREPPAVKIEIEYDDDQLPSILPEVVMSPSSPCTQPTNKLPAGVLNPSFAPTLGTAQVQQTTRTESTPPQVLSPQTEVVKNQVPMVKKKLKKTISADIFKRLYFKKKCQNAYLEHKKLLQEILFQKQEHNLRMLILKQNLQSFTNCNCTSRSANGTVSLN